MPIQPWFAACRTGDPTLDAHHDALIACLGTLYRKVVDRAPAADIDAAAVAAIEATIDHFAEEEKEMVRAGIPDSAAHASAHQAVRARLMALRTALAAGSGAAGEALEALNGYLAQHIKTYDQDLAEALAARRRREGRT
jgi:hemerythrin-like metal-binding protein